MSKPQQSKFLDLRDSPPDPKIAAPFAPRDLKTPGSFEWNVQTTSYAQGIWVSLKCTTKDWLQVVAEIDAQQIWKRYPPEKPYATREAYFKGEFGQPEPVLTQLKEAQQLLAHGGDRHSVEFKQLAQHGGQRQRDIVTLKRGNQSAYIRARLERDGHTELLEKIERGEVTAHAVAVQLGWRTRMIQHPATIEGFARAIRKYLSVEDRQQLKGQLE